MRTFLFLLGVLFATTLRAQDDRDRTTAVERQWLTDVSPAAMTVLQAAGWRFTDIELPTGASDYSVAMVKNTGSYAKTWTWRTAATAAELSTLVAQGLRIVDLEPYESLSGLRFAAILIANTGADGKAWWWWYDQTSAAVDANIAAVNGRLSCFKRYTVGGQTRFATVMISNTGSDYRPWAYLYAASSASINQFAAQNSARVYGMEFVAPDSYDVILIDNQQGLGHWFYYDIPVGQAKALVEQNLGRVADVEIRTVAVPLLSIELCTIAILDNANPLEYAARQAFAGAAAGGLGQYGFFLKQVNGPVLAALQPDLVFEPADTMKTLYHVHVLRQAALGAVSLTTLHNKPTSCGVPGSGQSYTASLQQMMSGNDDMAALALSTTFGIGFIEGTAAALGMTSTDIQWTIGCGGPLPTNAMTLRDLSRLHEEVENGFLDVGAVDLKPTFYAMMLDSLAFPTWGTSDLTTRIDQHALAIGMSAAARNVFKSKLQIAYKFGDVVWTPSSTPFYAFSEGGWMSVPFRSTNGLLAPREYTFGVFNNWLSTQSVSGRNAMCNAELELVWDRVKAAMNTWDDYVPGSIFPMPGTGCLGSGGVPTQSCSSVPDLEETILYSLANAPGSAIVLSAFGFSATNWSGVPLPADLAPVGAPGCVLRTDPLVMFADVASPSGSVRTPIVAGTDPTLIGVVWYSQFLVLDPPANAFGLTVSNALRTQIGGSF